MIQTLQTFKGFLFTDDIYRLYSLPSKENGPTSLVNDGVPMTHCKN